MIELSGIEAFQSNFSILIIIKFYRKLLEKHYGRDLARLVALFGQPAVEGCGARSCELESRSVRI